MESLNWILKKSGMQYKIIYTDHPVSSQKRKIDLVKKGEVDVIYAGTSIRLEKELLPIRFPVMRGLIGRRIFIINKKDQYQYDKVRNLKDLKQYTGIQGLGWGDIKILEFSGLEQVQKVYDDIFRMIDRRGYYYFPRGMTEVYSEYNNRKTEMPNLAVEKRIVLIYKTAVFFFINNSNKKLENIIKTGFLKSYNDGSYKKFFYNHPLIKSSMKQADLKKRIKIRIPNPYLSIETTKIPEKYWHLSIVH